MRNSDSGESSAQYHADELGLTILASAWSEYDASHAVMETRSLSAGEIQSTVEEIAREFGLRKAVSWRGMVHSWRRRRTGEARRVGLHSRSGRIPNAHSFQVGARSGRWRAGV
jgi:hypothetical protein